MCYLLRNCCIFEKEIDGVGDGCLKLVMIVICEEHPITAKESQQRLKFFKIKVK